MGDDDIAITDFEQAIEVLETQRASITSEKGRIGFLGRKQNVYRDLVKILIKRGQAAKAFEYAERGKARALVDLLATRKKFPARTAKSAQLRGLVNSAAKEELQKVAAVQKAGRNLRSVKLVARTNLSRADPELASLVSVQGADLSAIQKLLPQGETLIEYFGDGDAFFVFVVTARSISAQAPPRGDLKAEINAFRKDIQIGEGDAHIASGLRLYNRLIKPIEALLPDGPVTIVPHGPLHYLPFAALSDGRGQYLMDRMSIRILPSASVLRYLRPAKPGGRKTMLVMGNPDLGDPKLDLPGAEAEARGIAGRQSNATLLLRGEATESFFRERGNDYSILHFAGHGTFNAQRPLTSSLLMARDGSNDGALQVGELYEIKLNVDLVTLSGCETALGEIANGDVVVGFTRGFLFAGARSIVSSLWEVEDDATRQLMENFYDGLKTGDKRAALRQAQMQVRDGYNPHPFYWAAFQLTGSAN